MSVRNPFGYTLILLGGLVLSPALPATGLNFCMPVEPSSQKLDADMERLHNALQEPDPMKRLRLREEAVTLYNFKTNQKERVEDPAQMDYKKGLEFLPRDAEGEALPSAKEVYDELINQGVTPYEGFVRTSISIYGE